jgi:uncharacterized membrane protein YbhN (UPF0104 family)
MTNKTMRGTLKRIAWVVVRLGASAGLIWLMFSLGHFNIALLGSMLSHVAGWPLAAAMGCFLVGVLAAAYKWRELLREQGIRVGILRVLRLTSIALFYNLVLPGQESGNAVKAVLLGRASRKANKVWASVLVDQVMVFLATALITVVGLLLNTSLAGWPLWMALASFCLVGALGIHALFLSERLARPLDHVLRPLSRKLRIPWKCGKAEADTGWKCRRVEADAETPGEPLPGEWLAPLWDGLRSYKTTWHRLGYVLILSVVYQLAVVAVAYQFGLGLGIHISFLNLAWIMTLVNLAQALPISFAGVGTRDGTLVYFLGMLGVASGLALALSLSLLALNVLMGLPGAVIQLIPDRYLAHKEAQVGQGANRWIGQIPLKIHDRQPLVLPPAVWPRLATSRAVIPPEHSLRRQG